MTAKTKRIIGWAIIITTILAVIVSHMIAAADKYGWQTTITAWAIGLLVVGLIILSFNLIDSK